MPRTLLLLDWIVIAVYVIGVMLIGIYFSGRQKSTRDYFLGDRELPWWAVMLSIIATETSAVTFIGFPGMAYGGDWSILQLILGFVLGRIFLAIFFIKIFYRWEIITVYGFLEMRFGNATRVVAAILFFVGRVVASGVRLYAACLAIEIATGLPITLAILIMGIFGIGYTLIGGIRSVVWSDCLHGLTFLLGGIIAAVFLLIQIDGGLATLLSNEDFIEKIQIFHLGASSAGDAASTTWTEFFASTRPLVLGLLGGFVLTLATHGTDQDIVQRMLTCKDSRSGSKSLLGSAAILLPMSALFLTIGSLLWFHHNHATGLPGEITRPDGISNADNYFPNYIVSHIPHGIAGFLFAGIFAAALSSLTSVLNALSSTLIADFYRPLIKKDAEEEHYLYASRVGTVVAGVAVVGMAFVFIGSQDSILKTALGVLTYFYGSLLGVFLLGIFTKRGTTLTTIFAMFLAVPCVLLLQFRSFVENPEKAPDIIQKLMHSTPDHLLEATRAYVPLLGWSLWIVVGTLVTFVLGALGRQTIVRRG